MRDSKVYLDRIARLQKQIAEKGGDFFFVQNSVDLFYLTGMEMSLGYLYLGKTKARLFVDGRYLVMAENCSPLPVSELSVENMATFLKGGKKLLFDENKLKYSDFIALKKVCRAAKINVKSVQGTVDSVRLIKDEVEIRLMKKSAEFAYKAYEYIQKKLKPGVTELDLARLLEIYCLKHGASGMSFEPIIAFGKNTAFPHHHPGKTKLKANDIILFDLGVMLNGYASDMTRVDFIGKVDPKLREIFEVNKAAQRMALSKCRPGARLKELDKAARRVMASAGLEEYFVHNLGHGIGLEVHEPPRIKQDGVDWNMQLVPGMAITIEPGIYLPGKGGVRYEDTIIITEVGYTNLYP